MILDDLTKEELKELVLIYARNRYAMDGVWFQSVEQNMVWMRLWVLDADSLLYRVVDCRVQTARKRKGMPCHPCKSVDIIEYAWFAKIIDDRIESEVISCYPEVTDMTYAWKFTLAE